ncbi:MAG: hypothetical protein ACRD1K_03885 [Acidimicrobiales bacterium]
MIAVAIVATLIPLSRRFDQPHFVDRITFRNPTAYDLRIEVSGAGADGWQALGTARRNETTLAEQVYDIGDVWLFRFSAQGAEGGEVRLTRSQLSRDRWRIVIPDRVDEQLRARGAPPPP